MNIEQHIGKSNTVEVNDPRPSTVANVFQTTWDLGFRRLVPIIPHDAPISKESSLWRAPGSTRADSRGKAVGIRRSDGDWMGFNWVKHSSTESNLAAWHAMGAGVGIKTGLQEDGTWLLGIDADTLDEAQAARIRDVVETHFGTLAVRIGRAPKALYLIRSAEPFRYTRVEFQQGDGEAARVEILSDGRQFVAHGVHPATRKPYAWPQGTPRAADVPIVTPDTLNAFMRALQGVLPACRPIVVEGAASEVDQTRLRGDPATVRKAVEALPNTPQAFPERENYLAVGYAIKAALPDDQPLAHELFTGWCDRYVGLNGEINDPEEVDSDWRRMKPPFKRGASYVYELAEKHAGFDAISAEHFRPILDEPAGLFADEPKKRQEEPSPCHELKTFKGFVGEYAPLRYALEPIVRTGSLYALTAKTSAGKTALLISTAFAISTGRDDILRLVVEPGRVAFLTFENPDDVRMRMMVAAHHFGIDDDAIDDELVILDVRLGVELAIAKLAAAAAIKQFRLVIVDTFAAWFDGDDVNNAVQGGNFMRRMRPITRLPGFPAVIVATHPIKNATEEQLLPYGSGAILNEIDGNLTLWRKADKKVKLHFQGKLRGLEFAPHDFQFEITTAPTVQDAKGRLVPLPVLVPAETSAEETSVSKIKGHEAPKQTARAKLLKAIHDKPDATQREWAAMAGCAHGTVTKNLVKLQDKKFVHQPADGRWSVTSEGKKELERCR